MMEVEWILRDDCLEFCVLYEDQWIDERWEEKEMRCSQVDGLYIGLA